MYVCTFQVVILEVAMLRHQGSIAAKHGIFGLPTFWSYLVCQHLTKKISQGLQYVKSYCPIDLKKLMCFYDVFWSWIIQYSGLGGPGSGYATENRKCVLLHFKQKVYTKLNIYIFFRYCQKLWQWFFVVVNFVESFYDPLTRSYYIYTVSSYRN